MTPRSAAQNSERRARSRQRIIEEALRLFGEHGFDGTTIRMLAEGAGISQGLIYRYFASKDVLLQAIFEQCMEEVRAAFRVAEAGPPGQRVERLVRASFEVVRGNRQFWRLWYGIRMQAAVQERLGEGTETWMRGIARTLERHLAEDGVANPRLEAVILFALIEGVSQHYVLAPDVYPMDEVADRIAAAYSR